MARRAARVNGVSHLLDAQLSLLLSICKPIASSKNASKHDLEFNKWVVLAALLIPKSPTAYKLPQPASPHRREIHIGKRKKLKGSGEFSLNQNLKCTNLSRVIGAF